jgi:hypothetical protein
VGLFPRGEKLMSIRSSRQKFRPTIERFESRNLAATGLASLAPHAAARITAPQKELTVFIRNQTHDPELLKSFFFEFYIYELNEQGSPKRVYSATKPYGEKEVKEFDGSGIPIRWSYTGDIQPWFLIEFHSKPLDPQDPGAVDIQLLPAPTETYSFVKDGPGKIKLVQG